MRISLAARSILPIYQKCFDKNLSAICLNDGINIKSRIGLAISGGVDSMALASLCSRTELTNPKPNFTAFIVDHSLRQGSDEEAQKVSHVLTKLNIESKILKLDWSNSKYDLAQSKNMETVARTLRFQAIGRACRGLKIESLLLGHHVDDQVETIMSRLVSGYSGMGLRGMQSNLNIPECHGIYGVSESGSPRKVDFVDRRVPISLGIEHGGISIHRPLLAYHKASLHQTCIQNGVEWFEDATNADKSLTIRNTIRHLYKTSRLPAALSPEALKDMGLRIGERVARDKAAARALFNETRMDLDPRSGRLTVMLPPDYEAIMLQPFYPPSELSLAKKRIATLFLRMIFMLVTPKSDILTKDLKHVRREMLPRGGRPSANSRSIPSIAGLQITAEKPKLIDESANGMPKYVLHREKPFHSANIPQVILESYHQRAPSIDLEWTNWQLFDNRFWIRLRYRPWNLAANRSIVLRLTTPRDAACLSEALQTAEHASSREDIKALRHMIKIAAPGSSRAALPVIVERREVLDPRWRTRVEEEICAFPTLGWGKHGWRVWEGEDSSSYPWTWEWRYKMIDYGDSVKHVYTIESPAETELKMKWKQFPHNIPPLVISDIHEARGSKSQQSQE